MAFFSSLQEAREYFRNDRFAAENGFTLDALTEDGAVCSVVLSERHQNAEGALMGGAILALADFTFAAASVNAHRHTVAQQASLSFLSSTRGSRLISTAIRVKDGRSSCVYRVEIKDDLGRDVAQALFTGFKLQV